MGKNSIAGLLLFIAFVSRLSAQNAPSSPSVVLIVESYNREYAWDSGFRESLIERLGTACRLEWFEMDTKRLPPSEHQKAADAAWNRYVTLAPALVILCDDAALRYLGPRFATVSTPVVFLGINANPRTYLDPIPRNMTGILERPILKRSLVYINEIMPRARRGLILFDTDLTALATKETEFGGKSRLSLQGVDIDIRLIGDFEEWKRAVNEAPRAYDYIITGLYQTIRLPDDSYVDPETVIEWTSANTSVPLFSFWDFSVGSKRAIGGRVLIARDMGEIASGMALRILSGESPSTILKITETPGTFLFSKTQLERWGITLPPHILADATLIE